ncbi:MAG TPA: type II secretion system protein [Candidatus Omnitrophota bacterium]|nr:type II secretion system protein [Candidatus Omnitrophota bacterium]HPN88413.1 type II secretion system protein [Candidatus Omnitrophota bacterium]
MFFNKKKVKGFTLLELIISSLIFSILAVGLGATFFSGMRAWGVVKQYASDSDILFSLESFARELRQSMYQEDLGFEGSLSEITFLSVKNDRPVIMNYSFDKTKKCIKKKTRSLKESDEDKEDGEEKNILCGIEKYELYYLIIEQKKAQWLKEWKIENNRVPCAVKVTLAKGTKEFLKTVFIPVCR